VTVIVGFITGLVISGILVDVIKYVGKSFNRVSISWNISKAEKAYSNERFSDSISIYKKTLPKIDSENKILIAKIKNNLALSILKNIEKENSIDFSNNEFRVNINDFVELKEILNLLKQANDLYIETNNVELSAQTIKNIKMIEDNLY
jgi:hypothetical protein